MGLSIDAIAGTGPDGRVTSEDVAAAAHASGVRSFVEPAVETAPYDAIDVSGVRKMVADRLTKVVRETPLVTTFRTVDCTELQAIRVQLGLSPLPIVMKALADTCTRAPLAQRRVVDDPPVIHRFGRVDAGVAVDTDRGLMIGVVRDVGARSAEEIAVEIRRLARRRAHGDARTRRTASGGHHQREQHRELRQRGRHAPSRTPGVATVLAIGVIAPRALVVDGEVVARPACTLSLTFDHRVLDGAAAGRGAHGPGGRCCKTPRACETWPDEDRLPAALGDRDRLRPGPGRRPRSASPTSATSRPTPSRSRWCRAAPSPRAARSPQAGSTGPCASGWTRASRSTCWTRT